MLRRAATHAKVHVATVSARIGLRRLASPAPRKPWRHSAGASVNETALYGLAMGSCVASLVYQFHGHWRSNLLPGGAGDWLNDFGSRWIVPIDNARWLPPFWGRLWMDIRCGRTLFDAIERGDPVRVPDGCGYTVVTRHWTASQQQAFEAFVRRHMDAANALSGLWLTNSTAVHKHTVDGVRPIEYAIQCGHTQAVESLLRCGADASDRVWGNHDFRENLVQNAIDARQWGSLAALLASGRAPLPARIALREDYAQVQHQLARVAKWLAEDANKSGDTDKRLGNGNGHGHGADAFVHLVYHGVQWAPSGACPPRPSIKLNPADCFCSKCRTEPALLSSPAL